ncbi:MAG: rhodanese-like domain-containing protein [Acidimicrobiia bacterium]|nr:rhodanese-like domain-containing protein [Acidimicrobiia bacterium]
MNYAGDVAPTEAYQALQEQPEAILVDVRTPAELSYVGLPSLDSIGKSLALIQWHPEITQDQLVAALGSVGANPDTPLYFLCRSGARSLNAAVLATHGGFTNAYNVSGGFEGPLDHDGQRGRVAGWKADGLPWRQS